MEFIFSQYKFSGIYGKLYFEWLIIMGDNIIEYDEFIGWKNHSKTHLSTHVCYEY